MSSSVPTDLESFGQFVTHQIAEGVVYLSPEESVRLWRIKQREDAEAVDDIRQGIEDEKAGRLRPLAEVANEIKSELGFSK